MCLNLSYSIVKLSKSLMSQLRAPLFLRAAAEVILLLAGDWERIEQLCNGAAHVWVQNKLGIILDDGGAETLVNCQKTVNSWNWKFVWFSH